MNTTLEDEIREFAVALEAAVDRRLGERVNIAPSGHPSTTPRRRLRFGLIAAATIAALATAALIVVRYPDDTSNQQVGTASSADSPPKATTTQGADTATAQATSGSAIPTPPLAAPLNVGDTGPDVTRLQERLAELFFEPGPADGTYNAQTEQAVWAFKSLILQIPLDQLTGQVTDDVWEAMQQSPVITPRRILGTDTTHIEIYLPQQVLAVFTGDRPTLIAHISSGTGQQYCDSVTFDTDDNGFPLDTSVRQSLCGLATTPPGVFKISRRLQGQRLTPIGAMTNPVYFNYFIAIAGSDIVPAVPASRGSVMVNQTIAGLLPGLVHIGDTVYVWGDDGRQPENHTKTESLPTSQYPDPTGTTQSADPAISTPAAATTPGGHRVLAFGDSVMETAVDSLSNNGFATAVNESIQGPGMIENIAINVDYARNFDTVVIQVGTNGPVTQEQFDEMANLLKDVPHVYFLTLKAPKEWIATNNESIRSLPSRHPNVHVIDWQTRSTEIAAELSPGDGGIHLYTPAAIEFYTNLIVDAVDGING